MRFWSALRRSKVRFLTPAEVEAVHEIGLGTGGGASGVRDPGQLIAATMAPQNAYVYTLADLAAVYCHGIAEGQAFLDGNKRAAVLAADTFLRINGYHLELSADEGVRLMVGLATGELTRDDLARAFAVAMGGDAVALDED